jgi:predicted KAP-like P-loop ATPase
MIFTVTTRTTDQLADLRIHHKNTRKPHRKMTDIKTNASAPAVLTDDVQRWEKVTSALSADRPIRTLKEDVLNRGSFCISLANAIQEWKSEHSLVIGLYGTWGSGKSSVKNMVVSLLQESDPKIPVIEFNPWFWSGEERLVSAFFDEIGAALPSIIQNVDGIELSKKWKAFSARLAMGGTALGHLKTAAEFTGTPWIPIILGALSSSAESSAKLAEQASNAHNVSDDIPAHVLKIQLSAELKKLQTPIVVVLDDVDRLTTEEIRLLFRIVKANADFPNLVFIMLFDRDVVERSLAGHVGSSGIDYMEKIIQAGFNVPLPAQESIDNVLFDGLNAIIGADPARMKFSPERWQELYRDGLQPFFKTLRDVRRFLSSFAFYAGLFFKENALEVNLIDLIGIEVLRVFEPSLHRELAEKSSIVFGDRSFIFGDDREHRSAQKRSIENWLIGAADEHRLAVKELACCLFPQINWLLKNHGPGLGFEAGWLRELRVCHPQVFDRYFSLLVPEDDVSQAFISKLLAASGNRVNFRELLLGLASADKIAAALNRLEVYIEKIEVSNTKEVLHALFEVGEAQPKLRGNPFGGSIDIYACRIINELLRREQDVSVRTAFAIACLEETSALWIPCRFVALEEPSQDSPCDPHRDVFGESGINRAKKCVAKKIREASNVNSIVGERLSFYLWRWKNWSGDEEPREWTSRYVQLPENALQFLVSIAREVRVSSGRRSSRYLEIDMKDIEAFVNSESLKEILSPYLADLVSPEYQAIVNEHREVIEAAKKAFATR